ncbi:MAG: hypothetical protein HOK99_03735 [Betaproteobacteria bacterium]|jgi:hypothetical protein|nr:hypothetical protein [Betaproteobacteria bacterium]
MKIKESDYEFNPLTRYSDIEAYILENASEEYVFEWFQEHSVDEETELALLQDAGPIVKLGLALFGRSEQVVKELFASEDEAIRKAVLAGRSFGGSGMVGWETGSWIVTEGCLSKLVDDGEGELLTTLLHNPQCDEKIIADLYRKSGVFSAITDEAWFGYVGASRTYLAARRTSDAPRVFESDIFAAAWGLFELAPVTDDWAMQLEWVSDLLLPDKLLFRNWRPYWPDVSSGNLNIEQALSRWNKEGEDYHACRIAIAYFLNDSEKQNSEDLALRQSYYRRFYGSPEGIRKYFDKDKYRFLEAAFHNDWLYLEKQTRDALEECWREVGGDPSTLGDAPTGDLGKLQDRVKYVTFDERESEVRAAFPDRFQKDVVPIDTEPDYVAEIKERLAKIEYNLANIELNLMPSLKWKTFMRISTLMLVAILVLQHMFS